MYTPDLIIKKLELTVSSYSNNKILSESFRSDFKIESKDLINELKNDLNTSSKKFKNRIKQLDRLIEKEIKRLQDLPDPEGQARPNISALRADQLSIQNFIQ